MPVYWSPEAGAFLAGSDVAVLDICNLALLMLGESSITQDQLDNSSTKGAELCATFYPYVLDQVLDSHPWNFAEKHRLLDYTDDFGIYPNDGTDNDLLTITGITAADPPVVSVASHPYETGNLIYISDVSGMTEVNVKVFEITKIDAGSFSLIGVDGTKYTAYVSGGKCIRKEVAMKYSGGYTYDCPSDCIRSIRIDDGTNGPGPDFIVIGVSPNQRILTTQKDAVLIYTSQVTDADLYPSRFINVMAAALAMKLVIPLKKKSTDLKSITAFYQFHFSQGALMDFREIKQTTNNTDPWISSGGFNQ